MVLSPTASAFTQGCELVAQMAGPAYEVDNQKVASLIPPEKMPATIKINYLVRSGAWFIYQTDPSWFTKETCAPLNKAHRSSTFEFAPVIKNRKQGQYAVVTSSFMVKTYNKLDINKIAQRYGFKLLTELPSGGSAIFEVGSQVSYDRMLETLDRDKDIRYAAPVLSEKRYQLR